jgi:hypothetical protein
METLSDQSGQNKGGTKMLRRCNKSLLLLVGLLIPIFSIGCVSMESKFGAADRAGSISAYEAFLREYPSGELAVMANERIAHLKEKKAFDDAEAKNSIVAYRAFLQEYPSGTLAEEARKRIATPDWEAFSMTCQMATMQAFLGFIERYPSSEYLTIANARVEFLTGVGDGSLESYKKFIAKHPNNLFILEAKATFPSLWLSEEKKRVGMVIDIGQFVQWKGAFGGGRITKEELRQKVFKEFQEKVEKTGIDVLLLDNPADAKSKNLPLTLLMNYSEGERERQSSPDYGRPAGPGYDSYVAQTFHKAATDNMAAALTGLMFGASVNASTIMTIKDTNTAYEIYLDIPDMDYKVKRIQVIKALCGLKDKKIIPPLIVALHDKDSEVQSIAENALREITGQDLGRDQVKWMDWWGKNKPN